MTEYKAWDKVRIKEYCSWCEAWEICELHRGYKDWKYTDKLYARWEKRWGCHCQNNRELVESSQPTQPAPKFKVGDRVKIKRWKNWTEKMDWLIWVEATISEIVYYNTERWRRYNLKDFSKEWYTGWIYNEDMFDLVEEDITLPPQPVAPSQSIQQTFNILPNKPMTLLQEMFDRFLKSNKTKIIEAVETAEENLNKQDELKNLLDYFGEVNKRKNTLTTAYDRQDKEWIKLSLKELQTLNVKMNDKLFDQFFAVVKSLNKMLEK